MHRIVIPFVISIFVLICFIIISESFVELFNRWTHPVHWKLVAFAPPYVKGSDGGNTVKRVGYDVFEVKVSSGDLLPEETMPV
jgi:hypothetical protein